MPNYQLGKIYKISSRNGEDEHYIGSTTKPTLAQRMNDHKQQYKRWKLGKGKYVSSFSLFDKYGVDNCKIILLESYACNSKDELRAREDDWIKETNHVNKIGAVRDNEKAKAREQAHKKIEFATKINCPCGAITDLSNKARHEKTRAHINYMANPNWIQDNKKSYIKKRLETKVLCSCGEEVTLSNKSRHLRRFHKKEQIAAKFKCECDGNYDSNHKNRHMETKKHKEWVFRKDEANYLFAINI